MDKKIKYDDIVMGKKTVYTYKTFLIGIKDEEGCLKLRMAWDKDRFIIRSVSLHDGYKYIDIPKIMSTTKVMHGGVSEYL